MSLLAMKIIGAAAAEGLSFEQCVTMGQVINEQTVTIASALNHCHVPGREQQASVADDAVVIGAGIHNEPGQVHVSPALSVEELIERLLKLLCDETDPERAFVGFEAGDQIGLLVNNYGGLSVLELHALADEVQIQLDSTWKIKPCRTLFGAFETSLDAPGFSISLCNLTAAARTAGQSVEDLVRLFDRPTTAVSWPNTTRSSSLSQRRDISSVTESSSNQQVSSDSSPQINPSLLEKAIRHACERAIAAEPKLTQWDMIMGDGDCGEAVQGLAEAILQRIGAGCAQSGNVCEVIRSILQDVDNMGGTLGAIFGVLLSAFLSSLRKLAAGAQLGSQSPEIYADALQSAVSSLKFHTGARVGDRTVMDVLLPFQEEFSRTKKFLSAVKMAAETAEGTRKLKAKFGRATYVGDASRQEVPDPGAWALYEILAGLADGLGTGDGVNVTCVNDN